MHPPNTQNLGLLQIAEKAQHFGSHAKQERVAAVIFQTVSVVSVAVMGLAASAHLLRELFGYRPVPGNRHGHEPPRTHADRLGHQHNRQAGHDR